MVENPASANSDVQIAIGANDEATGVIDGVMDSLGGLDSKAAAVAGGGLAALSTALAVDAVNAASQFEDAMVDLQKVAGEGVADELEADIQQMAEDIPLTAEELAGLAEEAARFGIESPADIQKFVESTAKMATATTMNTDEAAEAFAKLGELTGTPVSEIESLGSSINTLSNNFATSSQEITQASLKSAGALNQLGLEQTEIFALNASLNEVSESADRAGTRLRRVAQEIQAAKPKKLASALGVTTSEFKQMRSEQPAKLFRLMAKRMNEGGSEADALRKQLSTTSQQAVTGLAQNLSGLDQSMTTANSSFDKGASLQAEFRQETEKTSTQQQLLSSKVNNVKRELGEELLPAFNSLITVVSKGVDDFATLNDRTDGMAAKAGLAATAVGGIGIALASLVGGPITLAIGAVGALAAAWATDFGGIQSATEDAMDAIQPAVQSAVTYIVDLWETHGKDLVASAKDAFGTVKSVVETTINAIQILWDGFGDEIIAVVEPTFDLVLEIIDLTLENVLETVDLFLDVLSGDWEGAWESVKNITENTLDAIDATIDAAVDTIEATVDLVIDAILEPFEWLADQLVGNSIVPDMMDDIADAIFGAVTAVGNAAEAVGDAIIDAIPTPSDMRSLGEDLGGAVADGLGNAKQAVGQAADGVGNKITGAFDSAKDKVIGNSIVPDMLNDVVAEFKSAKPKIRAAVTNATQAVINRMQVAAAHVDNSTENMKTQALTTFNEIHSASKNAFAGAEQAAKVHLAGIEDAATTTRKEVEKTIQKIKDAQETGGPGFGNPPDTGGGGGSGGGSGGDGGDSGDGGDGGDDGPIDEGEEEIALSRAVDEIQSKGGTISNIRSLSFSEMLDRVPHFRKTLKRIGAAERWEANLSKLPPEVREDLDEEDRAEIRRKFREDEVRNLVQGDDVSPEMIALATRPPADWDVGYTTPHPKLDFSELPYLEPGDARPGAGGGGGRGGRRRSRFSSLDTGGFLRDTGAIMAHRGERVLPESQVSDRGEASFDPRSVADGFDDSTAAQQIVDKLDRIDNAIRDDGTVRVSKRDVARSIQQLLDREGLTA